MKPFIVFLTLGLSLNSYASSLYISAPNKEKVSEIIQKLTDTGIDHESFSPRLKEDSIIISVEDSYKQSLDKIKLHEMNKRWLVLYNESGKQDLAKYNQALVDLHEEIPTSRIFLVKNLKNLSNKIREIQTEQKRLINKVAGLSTIASPVPEKFAPLGAAVLTSSGHLEQTGIKAIIHTASGSMFKSAKGYGPTTKSVQDSLINALSLAREHGYKRVAMPIIAGSIFREKLNDGQGMELSSLVDLLVKTAAKESAGMKIIFTVRADNPAEANFIKASLAKLSAKDQEHFEISNEVAWSIVKFNEHQASAIINSANMEVTFGGGVSGIIADACDGKIPADKKGGSVTWLTEDRPIPLIKKSPHHDIDAEAKALLIYF